MTTADERISSDLAVLGRASRERPIALETTLRTIGALPAATEQRTSTSRPSVALLALSRIFVQRVARMAAGATAFAATIGLLAYVSFPRSSAADYGGVLDEPLYMHIVWLAALVALAAVSAHAIVARASSRRFEHAARAAEDPLVAARRMTQRVAGWSVAATIIGVASFVLFFGFMLVTLGSQDILSIIEPIDDPTVHSAANASFLMCAFAILASSIAAVAVAHSGGGRRNYRRWILIGIMLWFATIIVGLNYDVGPLRATMLANSKPSIPLRGMLAVTGTLGVFLVVAGTVLRGRVRDDAELD